MRVVFFFGVTSEFTEDSSLETDSTSMTEAGDDFGLFCGAMVSRKEEINVDGRKKRENAVEREKKHKFLFRNE